ncbi:hypothetical protein [Bacillus cereus]|uniref:hypothetical protein n=1 Tax=Bacillus cereus TaxID=1396 RepID=UPI00187A0990|nr:hypothetical protein [Bacillus cereus]MBE7123151.1 hypothetical protein [Bacillus cereus]
MSNINIYRLHDYETFDYREEYLSRVFQRAGVEQTEIESLRHLLLIIGIHTSMRYSQLMYLMRTKLNRPKLDKYLKTLLYVRLIEKWAIDVDFSDKRNETCYTLSMNGYRYLKYWYGKLFIYRPDRLDYSGKYVHLRYWQDIDLLCHLKDSAAYVEHIMHPNLNGQLQNTSMALRLQVSPEKELNFVVYPMIDSDSYERLKTCVGKWSEHVEEKKNVLISSLPKNLTAVIIYVPTIKQATLVNKNLMLDLKNGMYLICIGETLHKEGLSHAFYTPLEEGKLEQTHLSFFE